MGKLAGCFHSGGAPNGEGGMGKGCDQLLLWLYVYITSNIWVGETWGSDSAKRKERWEREPAQKRERNN